MQTKWTRLVVETQLAVDLVTTGIRRISFMPMSGKSDQRLPYDQVYPLYAGLHTYTTGLERLVKLSIACHGFLEHGVFPEVRSFSHKIGSLLDALEDLEFPDHDRESWNYFERPSDADSRNLIDWLERFAAGGGRYEILDSLSAKESDILTWTNWQEFCAGATVSDRVKWIISMHNAIGDAIRDVTSDADLEAVTAPHLHEFDGGLHESSAAVALSMYRLARWPASLLDRVSHYTHQDLPILGEALVGLEQSSEDFFACEVARISDPDVAEEELLAHRENFVSSQLGEGDEDDFLD